MQENYAFMEHMHEGCYTKCTSKPDVTYMTMQEGLCFRNCLNKFNSWYPGFNQASNGAAFKTYWGLTQELEQELKRN